MTKCCVLLAAGVLLLQAPATRAGEVQGRPTVGVGTVVFGEDEAPVKPAAPAPQQPQPPQSGHQPAVSPAATQPQAGGPAKAGESCAAPKPRGMLEDLQLACGACSQALQAVRCKLPACPCYAAD